MARGCDERVKGWSQGDRQSQGVESRDSDVGVKGSGKVKGSRMFGSQGFRQSQGLSQGSDVVWTPGAGVKGRVDRRRVDWSEENLQLVITFDRLNQKVSLRGQNWVAHST